MSESRERFEHLRAAIEAADRDLVAALEARARAVRDVVALRAARPGVYFPMPTTDEVIERAKAEHRARGASFPEAALEVVVREVLGACASLAGPLRVAVPGPDPSLGTIVAREVFGSRAEVVVVDEVEDAIAAVERGQASFGVVPLETSRDGAFAASLFALARGGARVVGERSVPNAYNLYSRTGNAGDVEKIYGTRAALAACAQTLERTFPTATVVEVRSPLVAVELALADHGSAALATPVDPMEGLRVARAHVEEDPHLETRFVIVGREAPRRTGADRTFVALVLSEEPGSLYAALEPFAQRGINLTRLESRRAPGAALERMFFLEFDGHASDRAVLSALDEVRGKSRWMKLLGSYPRPSSRS